MFGTYFFNEIHRKSVTRKLNFAITNFHCQVKGTSEIKEGPYHVEYHFKNVVFFEYVNEEKYQKHSTHNETCEV